MLACFNKTETPSGNANIYVNLLLIRPNDLIDLPSMVFIFPNLLIPLKQEAQLSP